jgi:membrane associated rhomboid family serine protease|uniref:Peptidase S54 rhomboid domain-containing protein n=1 Tax=Haptolina ericina TaxID=156174 RepID=A0A7S3ETH6_9EUKA|mmetsp:Transcript_1835/g.4108  ORF Transcript_1835/g.4108 Transcript_1835/m.4108 type:complete len:202 (+) Transcript_1835:81-686(+)
MNAAILYGGQWHRLISPIFLHGGWYHLFANSFSLLRIGPLVENLYGPGRTILIYLLAGVGGNVAGLLFGDPRVPSVGASGSVLGLMGAVAAYVLRNKRQLGRSGDALLTQVGQLLLLNLFIGMRPRSGVDNLGHAGGALAGAVFGLLLAPRTMPAYDAPGDGSLLPPVIVRGLLGASLAATALAVRDTVRLALKLRAFAPA